MFQEALEVSDDSRSGKCGKEHAAGEWTSLNPVEESLFFSKEKVTPEGNEPGVGLQRYYFIYLY